ATVATRHGQTLEPPAMRRDFDNLFFFWHGAFDSGDGFCGLCEILLSSGRFSCAIAKCIDSHARRSIYVLDAAADNTGIARGRWPGGYSPEARHRRLLSCLLDGGARHARSDKHACKRRTPVCRCQGILRSDAPGYGVICDDGL